MPDKITLTLTLDELKELDKNLYYCEETWSIFDKIKVVYPQPKMTLANSGEFAVVHSSKNWNYWNRFTFCLYGRSHCHTRSAWRTRFGTMHYTYFYFIGCYLPFP